MDFGSVYSMGFWVQVCRFISSNAKFILVPIPDSESIAKGSMDCLFELDPAFARTLCLDLYNEFRHYGSLVGVCFDGIGMARIWLPSLLVLVRWGVAS